MDGGPDEADQPKWAAPPVRKREAITLSDCRRVSGGLSPLAADGRAAYGRSGGTALSGGISRGADDEPAMDVRSAK